MLRRMCGSPAALRRHSAFRKDEKDGTNSEGEYIFSDAGILPAGEEDDKAHTLTLTADTNSSAASPVEVTVTIHAEQID